jgi:hypothetical protein
VAEPAVGQPSPSFPHMTPDGDPLPCARAEDAQGEVLPPGVTAAPSNPPPSQDTAPEVPDKAPAPTMAAPPHAGRAIDECQRQGDGTVEENMMQREGNNGRVTNNSTQPGGYVASIKFKLGLFRLGVASWIG